MNATKEYINIHRLIKASDSKLKSKRFKASETLAQLRDFPD